jgi:hypothetical protein
MGSGVLATEELELNRRLMFSRLWVVRERYEVVNGVLVASGKAKRVYAPAVHPELPGEIAKLRREDPEALVRFAEMYGALGYESLASLEKRRGGDPLPWVWAHARQLHRCLALARALQRRDSRPIYALLDELGKEREEVHGAQIKRVIRSFGPQFKGDERAAVREILSALITKNLARVGLRLTNVAKAVGELGAGSVGSRHAAPAFRLFLAFDALIEVAYLYLANTLAGGRIQRCASPRCGAFFVQTDARQRYCPSFPFSTESACALRERQIAFQERNRKMKRGAS